MIQKTDIRDLEDIKVLVDEFYKLIAEDELLAPIFNFRLSTHWEPHLQKMYKFWNAALFGVKGYTGNPFATHATMPVDHEHFSRWINLFITTVDTFFEGEIAEDAKLRANIMATNFERRIRNMGGTAGITLV